MNRNLGHLHELLVERLLEEVIGDLREGTEQTGSLAPNVHLTEQNLTLVRFRIVRALTDQTRNIIFFKLQLKGKTGFTTTFQREGYSEQMFVICSACRMQ